jgi:hypothetical protein
MRRILWLALLAVSSVSATSAIESFQQPEPRTSVDAQAAKPSTTKVWIGRYAEYEEFLRTAEIERTETVGTGVLGIKRAFFKAGGLARSAALRSIRPGKYDGFFESYRSEIAAYKLDRLLELDMVPPTVERRYNGETVSLQLWGESLKMLKEVNEKKLRPTAPSQVAAYTSQLRRQKLFHNLTGNLDPNQGNIMFDPVWNVVLADFSRAFTNTRKLVFEIGQPAGATVIDRPFMDRIKALDREMLRRELGDFVEGGGAIDAILLRRDDIVKGFERLAKQKGDAQVFLP